MSNGIMSGTYYATPATRCGIFYTLGATVEKYIGSPGFLRCTGFLRCIIGNLPELI